MRCSRLYKIVAASETAIARSSTLYQRLRLCNSKGEEEGARPDRQKVENGQILVCPSPQGPQFREIGRERELVDTTSHSLASHLGM